MAKDRERDAIRRAAARERVSLARNVDLAQQKVAELEEALKSEKEAREREAAACEAALASEAAAMARAVQLEKEQAAMRLLSPAGGGNTSDGACVVTSPQAVTPVYYLNGAPPGSNGAGKVGSASKCGNGASGNGTACDSKSFESHLAAELKRREGHARHLPERHADDLPEASEQLMRQQLLREERRSPSDAHDEESEAEAPAAAEKEERGFFGCFANCCWPKGAVLGAPQPKSLV